MSPERGPSTSIQTHAGDPVLDLRFVGPLRGALQRSDAAALALAALWPVGVVWFGLFYRQLTPSVVDQVWKLHLQVLAGAAASPYQYQMWIHDALLGPVAAALPLGKPELAYSLVYLVYYTSGLSLTAMASYLLARHFGGRLASLAVVLHLCTLLPAFWYDNYYHPGDPWGWLASVAAVYAVVVRQSWRMFGVTLLFGGLMWEKNATLPASVLLAAWFRPTATMRDRLSTLPVTAVLLVAAGLGPLLPRLLYHAERAFTGVRSFAVRDLIPFGFALLLLVGPALWQLWQDRGMQDTTARQVRWLQAQLPLWLGIYLVAISAVLTEVRSISVLFFYAIPLTVRAYDAFAGNKRPYPISVQRDALL
jgi:hypothetical protein